MKCLGVIYYECTKPLNENLLRNIKTLHRDKQYNNSKEVQIFLCGVAPLKIENGRYGANRVPAEERLCMSCDIIEDEFHAIMQCPLYK